MSAPVGPPTLETDRLLLRPVRDDDLEALHSYLSLPEVCRWVPFEAQSLEEVQVKVARKKADVWDVEADHRGVSVGVVRREDGAFIGDLVLFSETDPIHQQGEVGYSFHPDVTGHGYATEAVEAWLTWAFDRLPLHRVSARVDTENEASWRLLERLGLRREAHLVGNEWFKGRWGDEYDYGVLATEWRERPLSRR